MTPACGVWHAAGASEDRAAPLQRWCPDQEPGCRSPVRRLAWWIDRPSASAPGPNGVRPLASSLVPWTGGGSEGSDPVRKRALPRRKVGAGSPDAAKSSLRDPARHGGKVYPSAGRPSETTEQGVLRALRDKVRGHRARAGTPCSSSSPRAVKPRRGSSCRSPAPHPAPPCAPGPGRTENASSGPDVDLGQVRLASRGPGQPRLRLGFRDDRC
jgi:hypothetical protein